MSKILPELDFWTFNETFFFKARFEFFRKKKLVTNGKYVL